jgi:hypothetical protein
MKHDIMVLTTVSAPYMCSIDSETLAGGIATGDVRT